MKLAFTNKFIKQVSKLKDKKLAKEIEKVIESTEVATSLSEIKNLKKLKGHKDFYRIRVGEYRIGIQFNNSEFTFAAIDNRKDIYKYFP
jgi:mRNA interferase RelE/StbE